MQRSYMAAVLFLGLTAALLVRAAEDGFRFSKAEVRKEVIAAIEGQLKAFRDRDVAKAYSYAAAAMRAQTPLRRFAAIVRENYREIWDNARAEYGLVRDDGIHALVSVHIFSDGGDTAYDYVLLKERGEWRIGSVTRHGGPPKNNA